MFGVGVGVRVGGTAGGSIDAQAQAHYNRVIADGGVVPAGVSGVNGFFNAVKTIYATSDITTAISVGVDAHYLGYKLGAGSGATSGQAAQKLYSCAGSSGDVVQTTAASQPLLLAHNGASSDNYYYAPGVSGNYISTTSTYQTDDWDVEFNVKGKYSLSNGRIAGTRSTSDGTNVAIDGTGITFEYKIGVITYAASASTTNTNDVEYTVRVTRNSATGAVTFIKNGVTLTTSGSQIAGTLSSNSYAIEINGVLGGVQGFSGNINWVKFYISGSVVRYFNPATYNASTSQTQWTSTTGEVWTINTGTATTGYKGALVDRTITMFDGVDDFTQNATVLRGNVCSQYFAYKTENALPNGYAILDGASSNYSNAFTPESTNMKLYMDSSVSGLSKTLGTTLALFTATNNQGVLNTLQRNNDTQVSNAYTPALSGTGITIGKLAVASNYQKGNVNTYLSAKSADNATTRTAIYNYIRTINNNAF